MSFCNSCGSEVGDFKFCNKCGEEVRSRSSNSVATDSLLTSKFCVGCGKGLISSSAVCPSCGTPSSGSVYSAPSGPKDKTVAILLAVFLGHWTWLYTYDKDSQKFWIGTGLMVLGLLTLIIGIGFLVLLGLFIWAIVDVATRTNNYYTNYPNG